MSGRERKYNFRKRSAQSVFQNRHNRIFSAEMVGINEIYAHFGSLKKTVVLYICCNIGITAFFKGKSDEITAGSTHYGQIFYRLACIIVSETFAVCISGSFAGAWLLLSLRLLRQLQHYIQPLDDHGLCGYHRRAAGGSYQKEGDSLNAICDLVY